jgi:NAD(P)-dependent dehydrogenase (short-subunit alcohol dehydrogenase family)
MTSSFAERLSLTGKVAVVTGGSSGIGRAIALDLAELGADVVIAARRLERAEEVAVEVRARARRALATACDVSREGDVRALFDTVERDLGGTDLFVHSAGVAGSAAASDVSRAEVQAMLDVHLHGGIACAQRAAAQMEARGGGAIVLMTSVFGLGAVKRTLAYGAAKAALAHAVKVMALEWAQRGVRVNGLAPGLVDTDMTAELPAPARASLVKRIPVGRAARPEEIAGLACMLLSDVASYMTGHILVADGGERAR